MDYPKLITSDQKEETISIQRVKWIFNNNLTPLDMYNGLSQVYNIKPEERIHF